MTEHLSTSSAADDEGLDPERVRELLEAATPGPWVWMFTGEKSNGWAMGTWQHEDGTWVPAGEPLGDYEMRRYEQHGDTDPLGEVTIIDQVCESYDGNNYADAALIALAPQLAAAYLRTHTSEGTLLDDLKTAVWR